MVNIVVVNWNCGNQILDALSSIVAHHEGLVNDVIVIDNNSSDDSLDLVEGIKNSCPFSLRIIRNSENNGFSAACNQGAKCCEGDYLLFLNPDTRLFPNSLSVPLRYMEDPENCDVGICGIQLIDEDGAVSHSCARFPTVRIFLAQALGLNKLRWFRAWSQRMGEWDHAESREVDQVIGAFFLIRRSVFEGLQGFDERFFVYFEEVDASYRARLAGWRSVYLANAQAFHAGGGTSKQVKGTRLFYSLRSRLLYGFKHFSLLRAWALVGVTLLLEPVSRLFFSLLRGGPRDAYNTIEGYGLLLRALPEICGGRKR